MPCGICVSRRQAYGASLTERVLCFQHRYSITIFTIVVIAMVVAIILMLTIAVAITTTIWPDMLH